MFDKLLKMTIAQIGTFDLYYYNVHREKELVKFCINNGISYLPAEDGRSIYRLVDEDFVKDKVDSNLLLSPTDLIFEDSTLDKFKDVDSTEVRFIIDNNIIIGVVHIVDYNNEDLYVELYRDLHYWSCTHCRLQ